MTWASASVALRPFSGSTPACAALPVTSTAYQRVALRAETMSPFSRAASRVNTAWWRGPSACSSSTECRSSISSSETTTKVMRPVVPPANVIEGTQGIEAGQQAGFHVAGTGTNQLVADLGDRAQRRRSARVDGVGMTEEQNPGAALPCSPGDQIIAPALLRSPLDREAESLQSLRQPVLDRVDPWLVVGAGVDARQVAQIGHVLIEVVLEVSDDGIAHPQFSIPLGRSLTRALGFVVITARCQLHDFDPLGNRAKTLCGDHGGIDAFALA